MRLTNRATCLATWLAVLALILLAAGCSGGKAAPGADAADALASGDSGQSIPFKDLLALDYVHAVCMAPASELEIAPRGVSSAFSILPQLPQAIPGARRASYTWEDLIKPGCGYDPALPMDNVAANGDDADFTPSSTGEYAGLAYCTYRFPIDGYGAGPDEPASVGFTWTAEPADWGDFYVGIADYGHARWQWYAGPDDRVLTIDSFDGMFYPGGDLLVVVALTGAGDAPALAEVVIGADEIRGTGGQLPTIGAPTTVNLAEPAGGLPAAVDLSPGCSAVNDQKWWPSCSCFALGDSVYNYELNRIYGPYGWDLDNPFNRISPKYMYVTSGEFQGIHPPGPPPLDGRWYDYDNLPYWDFGNATEWNAPYNMKYDKAWAPEAADDAALLWIDSMDYVNTMQAGGLTTAKVILAVQRIPLLIGVFLDTDFFSFEPGTVWNYNGVEAGVHAMAIVGYDDAKQAFKVRNSWGDDWGEAGYCWIGYDTFTNPAEYSIAITVHDSYDEAVAQHFCGQQPELPPPSNLTASHGRSYDSVTLDWNLVGSATGYRIYRDDPHAAHVAEVGVVDTWTDTPVPGSTSNSYWVSSINATTESLQTGPATGYTAGTPGRGDWYAPGRDSRNSLQSPFTGPPLLPAQESWRYVPADTSSSKGMHPVVQGDGSVVAYYDDLLACIDPDTGQERWSVTLPTYAAGIVLGADGTIYVTTRGTFNTDNKLFAYNSDGSDKWSTANLAYEGLSAPVVGADGTIYFGTDVQFGFNAHVLAYTDDGASASEKWNYNMGPSRVSVVLVGPDGHVYGEVGDGNDDQKVACLSDDGASASLVYETPLVNGTATKGLDLLCVLSSNVMLVNTPDNTLVAYNTDGSLRWTAPATGARFYHAGERSDGAVIAATYSKVHAYSDSATAATEIWASPDLSGIEALAIGADGKVYVNYVYSPGGIYYQAVLALDSATGALLWDFIPDPHAMGETSNLAIGQLGELFVGHEAGVFCLR